MVGTLKDNLSCKESRILSSNSKVKQFFVRLLSELHVLSQSMYIINADMAVSSADFTAFFQGKVLKVKTIINRLMLRAAATRRAS